MNLSSRITLPLPAPHFASRRHNWARFGGTEKNHTFASAERGRAQAFPLFAFLGLTILYEREKTILYERENYKQPRKNLLLYNFS